MAEIIMDFQDVAEIIGKGEGPLESIRLIGRCPLMTIMSGDGVTMAFSFGENAGDNKKEKKEKGLNNMQAKE